MSQDTLLERSVGSDSNVSTQPDTKESTKDHPANRAGRTHVDSNVQIKKPTRNPLLSSDLQLSQRQEMIRIISNRLFVALSILMAITILGGYLVWSEHSLSAGATNWMVILCGAIGGFISLQRRLKTLKPEDLLLLARSWVYVLLSPLVGGILALLLYFLFISGLLDGDLFPDFQNASNAGDEAVAAALSMNSQQPDTGTTTGMSVLFSVQGVAYTDYAKIIFWCFLAGYSESFVTNIISHFEANADPSTAER